MSFLQKKHIDPLGLGDRVRAKSRNWDDAHFQEIYPHLNVTVKTKINIIQTGVWE
ncbi:MULTISPECIES: Ger(x)C family spore germination C-terminal domain-containing protein [unclassified Paenibacillus]